MIERLPAPTRQHRYRITPGGFTQVMRVQLARMGEGIATAELGLSLLDGRSPSRRARLEDFRNFCEFSARDAQTDFLRRWEEYRAQKESNR